jgi:hypothetical protein
MDRLKALLAVLKRHHFWALCGAIVVVGPSLWWMATDSLEGASTKRRSEIEGHFTAMDSITNQPAHPNEDVIAMANAQTVQAKQDVLEAWRRLYQEQTEKNRLPDVLSDEFKEQFKALERNPEGEMPSEYLNEYRNNIRRHIRDLFEMVDYLRPASADNEVLDTAGAGSSWTTTALSVGRGQTSRGEGGRRISEGRSDSDLQNTENLIGVVNWDEADRGRLEAEFTWLRRPMTEQVRLAQEDLWVYEALLRIIKNTNVTETGEPARNPDEAAVKRIESLLIGKGAVAAWQGAVGKTGGASDGGLDEAALTDNRYVDAEGQPLAAGAEQPFAGFKLMPINMKLEIDQTKLARLLVECANSSMPVEVRKVSLGTPASAQGVSPGGGRGEGGLSRRLSTSSQLVVEQRTTFDIPVEIQGTICIYNPPDKDMLGTGTDSEAPPEAQPTALPAEPAGQPPEGTPDATAAAALPPAGG